MGARPVIPNLKGMDRNNFVGAEEVQDEEGEQLLEADTIIYAVGQSPLRKESAELSKIAPEFYQIGDCITPRNIYYATSEAYQAAIDLGRF